jgi:hypothetical protein
MRRSGPVTINRNGQIVSGLTITADGGYGICCVGFSNVIIRNCTIAWTYKEGIDCGILIASCRNVKIQNCSVTCLNNTKPGIGVNAAANNVYVYDAIGVTISWLTTRDGARGIFCQRSAGINISGHTDYNSRGPYPAGQAIQFNECKSCSYSNFAVQNNLDICWTEDNINVYYSTDIKIFSGSVSGNNSPSGCGVISDAGSDNVTVSDVVCKYWSNGAFSAWGAAGDTKIDFTRCASSHWYTPCSQGRGEPLSGGNCFATGTMPNSCGFYACTQDEETQSPALLYYEPYAYSADCTLVSGVGATARKSISVVNTDEAPVPAANE